MRGAVASNVIWFDLIWYVVCVVALSPSMHHRWHETHQLRLASDCDQVTDITLVHVDIGYTRSSRSSEVTCRHKDWWRLSRCARINTYKLVANSSARVTKTCCTCIVCKDFSVAQFYLDVSLLHPSVAIQRHESCNETIITSVINLLLWQNLRTKTTIAPIIQSI